MLKDVTVIIPTYNKHFRLLFTLESLRLQTEIPNILVIDDGSNDDTEKTIQKYKNKLDISYLYQQNRGRSHARNLGLKNCVTEYVIFCDDDVILPSNFIEEHMKILTSNKNKAVHGKIWNLPFLSFFADPQGIAEDESKDEIVTDVLKKYFISLKDVSNQQVLEETKKILGLEKLLMEVEKVNLKEWKFLYCTGGNFSCKTGLIKEVGCFDETLDFKWGCEDIELGYRLQMAGTEFIYSNEAYNYHISHYRYNYE